MSARKLAMSVRRATRCAGVVLVLVALVGGVVATGSKGAAVDGSAVSYSTLDYVWT